jgi:hypothetical protein
MIPFTRQELETGLLMLEDPGYLQTTTENKLLGRLLDAYPTGEFFQPTDWIRQLLRTHDIQDRRYAPWMAEAITEAAYWQRAYLQSRQDLARASEICREAAESPEFNDKPVCRACCLELAQAIEALE